VTHRAIANAGGLINGIARISIGENNVIDGGAHGSHCAPLGIGPQGNQEKKQNK